MENQYNENETKTQKDDYISDDELLDYGKNKFEVLLSAKFWLKILNIIIDTACIVLFFVLGTNMGFSVYYTTSEISGPSMKPTFNADIKEQYDEKDEVAVYYLAKDYERGDVIIYNHNGTHVIKRIIALGGDRIKIEYDLETNKYYFRLNGEILEEDYVAEEYSSMMQDKVRFESLYKSPYSKYNCKEYFDDGGYLNVPEGYIFYVGDNRTNSSDCTEYGPQPIENIEGKVIYKYSKTTEKDKYELFKIKVIVFYGNLFKVLKPNF